MRGSRVVAKASHREGRPLGRGWPSGVLRRVWCVQKGQHGGACCWELGWLEGEMAHGCAVRGPSVKGLRCCASVMATLQDGETTRGSQFGQLAEGGSWGLRGREGISPCPGSLPGLSWRQWGQGTTGTHTQQGDWGPLFSR